MYDPDVREARLRSMSAVVLGDRAVLDLEVIYRQCSQFVTVSDVAEHEKQCDKKGKSKALMAR